MLHGLLNQFSILGVQQQEHFDLKNTCTSCRSTVVTVRAVVGICKEMF